MPTEHCIRQADPKKWERKCLFKLIDRMAEIGGGRQVLVQSDYDQPGIFLKWAQVVDYNHSTHPITVALVECSDGTVSKIDPERIKFI